jgi:type VI secretion system protein ImpA
MKILVGNNSNALNQIDSLIGMNDTPINMENNSLSTQSGGHSQQYTESPTSNSDDAESSASNQSNNNEVTQATANSDVSDFEW